MTNIALGLFGEPDSALAAAGTLKGAGFANLELMSPVPIEGIEAVLGKKESVIKRFTLFGGIIGALSGFSLAAGTAVLYLHPAGGRPIITIPPYLIITYELLILFGILFTVVGFFISARLPVFRDRVYVPETGVDKFAVSVACDDAEHFKRAQTILQEAGAEQVREATEEG
ncbi:MAG: DUF3341 domain-containing protein [Pseudomonadales bacterium]|jgi:hypothetical protein